MSKSGFLLHIKEKQKIPIVSDFTGNVAVTLKKANKTTTPHFFMRQNPVKFKSPSMILFFVISPKKSLISSSAVVVDFLVVFGELLIKYQVCYIKAAEHVHHFYDF